MFATLVIIALAGITISIIWKFPELSNHFAQKREQKKKFLEQEKQKKEHEKQKWESEYYITKWDPPTASVIGAANIADELFVLMNSFHERYSKFPGTERTRGIVWLLEYIIRTKNKEIPPRHLGAAICFLYHGNVLMSLSFWEGLRDIYKDDKSWVSVFLQLLDEKSSEMGRSDCYYPKKRAAEFFKN